VTESIARAADTLRGKVAAVTGARGYIGASLVDELTRSGVSVLRVSRRELAPRPGMADIVADVSSLECWTRIVERADVIFHLAGSTSVYAAKSNPQDSLSATLLPINLLVKAAQDLARRPRVVFASTATVYGLTPTLPVDETAAIRPITVYDLHKYFAEEQVALATALGTLEGISLRLANIYGPSSSVSSAEDRGILNRVARTSLQGVAPKLYGGGEYVRDYVYIADVVDAFVRAGATPSLEGGAYNIGGGVGTTIRRAFELVVDEAERQTGKRLDLESVPWPANADAIEFRHFVASTDKFTAATGWRPATGVEAGIKLLMSELKTNHEEQR
jgi:UDP-glucose 4-epimerase